VSLTSLEIVFVLIVLVLGAGIALYAGYLLGRHEINNTMQNACALKRKPASSDSWSFRDSRARHCMKRVTRLLASGQLWNATTRAPC